MLPHFSRGTSLAVLVGLAACGEATDDTSSASSAQQSGDATGTGAGGSESESETGEAEGACATDSALSLAECVERERYLADLEFVAQPREPGSQHWQAVQDLCAERLTASGFEVDLHDYGTGINVLGRKLGTTAADEQVLIAAHYDHIPGCNGADDNASGVAGVLEAARVLGQAQFSRTLLVACWDEEESGLVGSGAYAELAGTLGDNIIFNYNFEMIGYRDDAPGSQTVPAGFELLFPDQIAELEANEYRGDFLALIVDDAGVPFVEPLASYAEGFGLATLLLPVPADLKNSPLLADLRRSDHANFWERDIPAVMLTDTSEFRYDNYHCAAGEDAVELLDHDYARAAVAATVGAAADALELR